MGEVKVCAVLFTMTDGSGTRITEKADGALKARNSMETITL